MVCRNSDDNGISWQESGVLTPAGASFNHTYARKPWQAHPDFSFLWSDGHAFEKSESSLYFCNDAGNVFRLPREMREAWQKPERL